MKERLRSESHKLKHLQDPGRWAKMDLFHLMGEAGQTHHFFLCWILTYIFHNNSSIYSDYFRLRGNITNPHVHTTQLNKEDFQIQLRFFTSNWSITYMLIFSILCGKYLYLCPFMKPVPNLGGDITASSPCQTVPPPKVILADFIFLIDI